MLEAAIVETVLGQVMEEGLSGDFEEEIERLMMESFVSVLSGSFAMAGTSEFDATDEAYLDVALLLAEPRFDT